MAPITKLGGLTERNSIRALKTLPYIAQLKESTRKPRE